MQAPFDRSIVTAAASRTIPQQLLDQLSPDGIMIAPMGTSTRDQHLYRFHRGADGEWQTDELWSGRFVPLVDEDSEEGSG